MSLLDCIYAVGEPREKQYRSLGLPRTHNQLNSLADLPLLFASANLGTQLS